MAWIDRDQGLKLDKNATKIALGYVEGIEQAAILNAIAPQIKVPQNGQYPTYGTATFYNNEGTQLAPGSTSVQEYIWPAESWNAYVIETHALKGFVSYQYSDNTAVVKGMVYSDPKTAAKALTRALYQRYSYITAYTAVHTSYSASPGTDWDDAGATPFDDMQTWVKELKDAIGVGGYGCILTDRVMWHLGEGVRSAYSHTGNMSNYEIVSKNLTRDLGINNLYVSDSAEYYSSSDFVSIWGDNVVIFKSAKNPSGWEPSYMATLVPDDRTFVEVFKPYETPDKTGVYVQVRMNYLVKELLATAIYMGSDVI